MSIPPTRAKIGVVPTEILLSYDGLSFHATTTCMIFPAKG